MSWKGWLPSTLLVFGFFVFPVSSCLAVCVILSETVIIGRIPRPIPDPGLEKATIKVFIYYGFARVEQVPTNCPRMIKPELVERACNSDLKAIRQFSRYFLEDEPVFVVFESLQSRNSQRDKIDFVCRWNWCLVKTLMK